MLSTRTLGTQGRNTSILGLGCMGIGLVPFAPLGRGFLTSTVAHAS